MTPPRADRDREFAEFASAHARGIRRTAYLLCGDWHRADDLAQQTLTKVYVSWHRITARHALDGYVRRTLVNTFLDERRRPWRRERSTGELPDRPAPAGQHTDHTDDRLALQAALATLPPTQRAAVILRYWEDLSIAETARLLGLPEGTVKSSTARGLAALREVLQGSRSAEPAR
jgi:RNA polymerase sigma-70 factor (sigma-E family)